MDYKNTLMYKEILQQPEALQNAARYNAAPLKRLAAAVKKFAPEGAYLAARGTSDHAGVYFKYLAESLWGLPVAFAAPSAVTLYGGRLNLKRQLVIAVSQSGKAADALEIVRLGRAQGALTVSVTNDESSPLAREAEYHLFCAAGEEKSVAATKTFTTELLLLALLAANAAEDKELFGELSRAPEVLKSSFSLEKEVYQAASRFANDRDCYVLGRGYVYAAVLEASLKLQETSYLRAKSYSSSDFVHGPFAVLDAGTKVILLAPDDESKPDSAQMLKRLREIGADITLITDSDELSGQAALRLSKCGRYNFIFAAMPVIQLFACALSCGKGLTPDAPRGLNKVTVTR